MSEGAVPIRGRQLTGAGCRLGTRMPLARTKILKGAFVMADQSHPQTQTSTSPTTGVFALLKAKPGVTRERIMAIMPAEIRATVQLYLDGKIREWYSRDDGRGGVFLLNARDVAEAESIMESLPLAKEDLLDHEYLAVGPLMPLRLLMANQLAKPQAGSAS
jgi:hypothetical protein